MGEKGQGLGQGGHMGRIDQVPFQLKDKIDRVLLGEGWTRSRQVSGSVSRSHPQMRARREGGPGSGQPGGLSCLLEVTGGCPQWTSSICSSE